MTDFTPNASTIASIGSINDGFALGKGAETAAELYSEVGMALTMWEASEDMLLSIFRLLCGEMEPTACDTYRVAPRSSRNAILKSACKRYSRYVTTEEASSLATLIKKLDKLTVQRNEIAHGQVMPFNATIDGQEAASGHFLLSSLHGDTPHDQSFKYAYTPEKISKFNTDTRAARSGLIDINFAIFPRVHNWNGGMSPEQQDAVRFAILMAKGEMSRANFVKWVKMSGF